ncbi:MAG: stimulus-sensing domain-containing protein [Rhodomicrobiaceae bacterium]
MTSLDRDIATEQGDAILGSRLKARARLTWRRIMKRVRAHYSFTTLKQRIVVLNLIGVMILIGGSFYLSDFRDRLIAARSESLKIEAEIIAKALTMEGTPRITDSIEDVILGQPVESVYKISLEKAAELLRTLVKPAKTNGYIYSADGTWLMDSNRIYDSGKITQYQNSGNRSDETHWTYWLWLNFERLLRAQSLPPIGNISMQNGKALPEVAAALEQGSSSLLARENEFGETILSYAVPISKGGTVLGALLLTTGDGEIDEINAKERTSLGLLLGLIVLVTIGVSLILSATIAGPMRRLGTAAEQVRNNIKARVHLPDLSHRADEVGDLSRALSEMTEALYARLETIESFAADVAHELKNPLTSLQSAIDTLPLARREEDKEHLMQIVQHDLRRLNRLITDISNASRLDTELLRGVRHPVNVATLLDTVCATQHDIYKDRAVKISYQIKGITRSYACGARSPFRVYGDKGRLSQVIVNLIDNAVSFSPENGRIRVSCALDRKAKEVEITVDDDGPGIPPENLEKIFQRFYTDRPEKEEFGNNSGLGLNISRQIVNAHKGRIRADNRMAPAISSKDGEEKPQRILGARFTIRLPIISREP